MKKNILLFILFISLSTSLCHSQVSKKAYIYKECNYSYENINTKSNIGKAGFFLKESAKFQIGAFACGAASAISFGSSALTKNKGGYERTMFIAAGSVTAVAAIVCQILSIKCKLKSGKYLIIHAEENNTTLSLNF